MNIKKTIENVRLDCTSYIDPDLAVTIILDDFKMGNDNIEELNEYSSDESFEENVLKISKNSHIFIKMGMISFIPLFNECDIFSSEEYHIKLTKEEFEKYGEEKEKFFGVLIKKDSDDYTIGLTDLCACEVDSSFCELEKSGDEVFLKISEIIENKIIS